MSARLTQEEEPVHDNCSLLSSCVPVDINWFVQTLTIRKYVAVFILYVPIETIIPAGNGDVFYKQRETPGDFQCFVNNCSLYISIVVTICYCDLEDAQFEWNILSSSEITLLLNVSFSISNVVFDSSFSKFVSPWVSDSPSDSLSHGRSQKFVLTIFLIG